MHPAVRWCVLCVVGGGGGSRGGALHVAFVFVAKVRVGVVCPECMSCMSTGPVRFVFFLKMVNALVSPGRVVLNMVRPANADIDLICDRDKCTSAACALGLHTY